LEDIVGDAEGLTRRLFALHKDCVAERCQSRVYRFLMETGGRVMTHF
jgi:hypothetical protein